MFNYLALAPVGQELFYVLLIYSQESTFILKKKSG